MERQKVYSSTIHSIGRDDTGSEIQFHARGCIGMTLDCHCDLEGPVYHYPTITAEEHQKLLQAPSIGSHFHKFVRNVHTGTKR